MSSISFEEQTDVEPRMIVTNKMPSLKKKINPKDVHFSFFEDALAKIKEEIIDEKIGFSNLVITIIKLIEIVERYKILNGLEKKSLVLKVIYKYIEDSNIDDEDKENLHYILNQTGTQIIDSIIFASKGKLFKKIGKEVCKIFKCKWMKCKCCFSGK
tara:strand:- start:355 stop:825 length:471 start_codon:yes stop_codon:yes gene_type:complete